MNWRCHELHKRMNCPNGTLRCELRSRLIKRCVEDAAPYAQSNVGDGACRHPALSNVTCHTTTVNSQFSTVNYNHADEQCSPLQKYPLPPSDEGGGPLAVEGEKPIKCDLSHLTSSLLPLTYYLKNHPFGWLFYIFSSSRVSRNLFISIPPA